MYHNQFKYNKIIRTNLKIYKILLQKSAETTHRENNSRCGVNDSNTNDAIIELQMCSNEQRQRMPFQNCFFDGYHGQSMSISGVYGMQIQILTREKLPMPYAHIEENMRQPRVNVSVFFLIVPIYLQVFRDTEFCKITDVKVSFILDPD